MLELLLPPTRFESPSTAGSFTDVALRTTPGTEDDDEILYLVEVHALKSSSARFRLSLDHSTDGIVTATHTSSVIAAAAIAEGDLLSGDADRSTVRLPVLHPVLGIGSSGTGSQWMVLSVWQMRKRYLHGAMGATRRVGVVRVDSGTLASTTGIPLPGLERGDEARVVSYHCKVLEASSSAQVGLTIQHGPDGRAWAAQRTVAPQSVSGGTLAVVDCDVDKGLARYVRPVLTMQATAGEHALVAVFETAKSV